MTTPAVLLVVVSALAQAPNGDTLRLRVAQLPDSALLTESRLRPLVVRDALGDALAAAVTGPAKSRREALLTAERLAQAYALAWRDSFFVREVVRFVASSPEWRAAKVWIDSVRRAGIVAYGRDGPRTAIAVWSRGLARASATRDTVAMASMLGNIGAALWRDGQFDRAERYLERAQKFALAIGDKRVEANAVGALANVSADRGELAQARERYTRALALREQIGDSRGVAADHNNLGLLAQSVGDLDEARHRFETALALNRSDGREDVAATNLVNLAGLASLSGDFAHAVALYRDALEAWRSRAMWAESADAFRGLGQLELRRGDYPAAAADFRQALTIFGRTGPVVDALAVRGELAGAMAAMGQLQPALDELRRAQHSADSSRAPPAIRAGIALQQADIAVQLNTLAVADRWYVRAELLAQQAHDPAIEAEARSGRGTLLIARDDYRRAQAMLESALRLQLASGNLRGAALTRLSLGSVAAMRGDTARARRYAARVALELQRLGDPVGTAAALGERAAIEAALQLPATAESLYRAALGNIQRHTAPEVSWRLHAGIALARRAQGFADDAVRELRAAASDIERSSRSLAVTERRSAFLMDKWEVYSQLALTELARGRTAVAFDESERLRAREMLELLARGRVDVPGDTAEELIAREQDLRRRIAELTDELELRSAPNEALRGPDLQRGSAAAREELARAQDSYAELLQELHDRAPRLRTLLAPSTVSWRDIARRLAPDEAFVEYLLSDSGSVAFVIASDTVGAIALAVGRRDLAQLAAFARGTLEATPSSRSDSLWRGPLRRLHQFLIAPLEESGLLAHTTRLVLVPHAELHYVPFAALLDSRHRFLVERYEVEMTPSASLWLALSERQPRRASAGFLIVAPKPDALPASRREVAAIQRRLGADAQVLIAGAATEETFRREAPTRRVLHLATYGILNKRNPLFSFLALSPDGTHDGRLEVHEVFGLQLAADLVVLSACETGVGSGALADVPPGDDWVSLTRAFLHAGASQVVATLWAVDDQATAALMDQFYAGYSSGRGAAYALARAQRQLMTASATAHPFYWAGFVVAGGASPRMRLVNGGDHD